eukprot:2941395-Prymnesium_polylepis.1
MMQCETYKHNAAVGRARLLYCGGLDYLRSSSKPFLYRTGIHEEPVVAESRIFTFGSRLPRGHDISRRTHRLYTPNPAAIRLGLDSRTWMVAIRAAAPRRQNPGAR